MSANFKSHVLMRDEKGFLGVPFKRLLLAGVGGGLTYTLVSLALPGGSIPLALAAGLLIVTLTGLRGGIPLWQRLIYRLRGSLLLVAVRHPGGLSVQMAEALNLPLDLARLDGAPLTPPVDYADAGLVRDRIDGAFAGEGLDAALIAAREEAERSGTRSLGTPLFDADDGAVRHIDGGVVRSDLRQGIGEAIGRSGGPDQFALGGFEQGRGGQDVQLGVPVALDDAVSQYLWSFAAVGHEHGVEAVVAAEVVVAGGDECGVALAVGVDEQDTAIAGFDMAQHVHQSQCDVGGRSGLADATLVVGENDGTGHDRGLLRKLIE